MSSDHESSLDDRDLFGLLELTFPLVKVAAAGRAGPLVRVEIVLDIDVWQRRLLARTVTSFDRWRLFLWLVIFRPALGGGSNISPLSSAACSWSFINSSSS